MELFSAEQIRQWDLYTIAHEPISSIELMERAAKECVAWIEQRQLQKHPFLIFCAKGNNGGDGLAIGRLLYQRGTPVQIYVLESGKPGSEDFEVNLQRIQDLSISIAYLKDEDEIPSLKEGQVVIDALFGSGLNKPLDGLAAKVVASINQSHALVVSIDLPSGLYPDKSSSGNTIVQADYTLSFQVQKLAFLVSENAPFIGTVHILDIGLHPGFLEKESSFAHLINEDLIVRLYKPRSQFAHKGTYGHALLIGGSYGKIGAVLLATRACLHTGAGLTTVYLPKCGYTIIQSEVPEAMVQTDSDNEAIKSVPDSLEKYSAIGLGPGLGTDESTQIAVRSLLNNFHKPLIIDADGLNCLAKRPVLLQQLPPRSILTPHPKEFERMFGESKNDFERIYKAQQKAKELNIILLLKGHHTLIATPSGQLYFNSTGNAGMAKGGSGDVLTGILTSLVTQGYEPLHAALLGVYLHGLCGDFAAKETSQEAMISSDLIGKIGAAFLYIASKKTGL